MLARRCMMPRCGRAIVLLCGVLVAALACLPTGVVGNSFYVDFGALVDAIAEGRGDTRVVALSELSDGQASSLARALATDACVVDTLTLYSSPLSAATIRALATAAAGGRVTKLSLLDVNLDAEGVAAIAAAVRNSTHLRSLDLAGNNIGKRGAGILAAALSTLPRPALTELDLSFAAIGDEGCVALAAALGGAALFDDGSTSGSGSGSGRGSGTAAALGSLAIRKSLVTDVCAAALGDALATNTGLHTLHLGNDDDRFQLPWANTVTDTGMRAVLEGLQRAKGNGGRLSTLTLVGCDVTDEAGVATARLLAASKVVLSRLDLLDNAVGDETAQAFAEAFPARGFPLVYLGLGAKITSAGFALLGHGLASNEQLGELDVSGNEIDAEGVEAFGARLYPNTHLWSLALDKNPLGESGAAAAVLMLHRQRGHMFQSPVLNKGIAVLSIGSVGIADGEGVQEIKRALAEDVGLSSLTLQGNALSDAGVAIVTEGLQANTRLRYLNLREVGVTDAGVSHMTSELYTVATGATPDPALGIPASALTSLVLANNGIGNAAADALGSLLGAGHTLAAVDLSQTGVTDVGALSLLAAAQRNKVVKQLVLQQTGVSPRMRADIARACHAHRNPATAEEAAGEAGSPAQNLLVTLALAGGLYFLYGRRNQ